jgi:hypothetical protein
MSHVACCIAMGILHVVCVRSPLHKHEREKRREVVIQILDASDLTMKRPAQPDSCHYSHRLMLLHCYLAAPFEVLCVCEVPQVAVVADRVHNRAKKYLRNTTWHATSCDVACHRTWHATRRGRQRTASHVPPDRAPLNWTKRNGKWRNMNMANGFRALLGMRCNRTRRQALRTDRPRCDACTTHSVRLA